MALFTAILEFDGGTYISQLRARSKDTAAAKHADRVLSNKAIGTPAIRKRLARLLAEDKPVAVEGVQSVWCCFAAVGNKSALVNLVATTDAQDVE